MLTSWVSFSLALFLVGSEPMISTAAGTGQAGDSGDGGPASAAKLNMPFDVAFDSQGNLYFTDTFNHRLRRIDQASGVMTTVGGNGHPGFSGDGGPATQARLDEPYGIVVDARGNLFFADRLNRRVRRIDGTTGLISTVAGNGTGRYSGDGGPGDKAGLVEPNGVALSVDGRTLYIADVAGHRVRCLDLTRNVISTFAGTGKARHEGDGGPAREASIWGARAVDIGPDGSVYILEREGNTLRKVECGIRQNRDDRGDGPQRLLSRRRPGRRSDIQRAERTRCRRRGQCLDRRYREPGDPRH